MGTSAPPIVEMNRPLAPLLAAADHAELAMIVDVLTDSGKGRVSLAKETLQTFCNARAGGHLGGIAADLAEEICRYGGNTFVNLVRAKGAAYDEVAADAAAKLGRKVDRSAGIFAIENAVLEALLAKTLAGLGESERRALLRAPGLELGEDAVRAFVGEADTDHAAGQLLAVLGSARAQALLRPIVLELMTAVGVGVGGTAAVATAGASFVVGRTVSALNPVTFAAMLGVTAYQLSGPAFRVTLPVVAYVACIRRAQMAREYAGFSSQLEACL